MMVPAGFFYTRYPDAKERPAEDLAFYQQVYFHKLGAAASEDRYELGKDFPKVAEIRLQAHPKKNYTWLRFGWGWRGDHAVPADAGRNLAADHESGRSGDRSGFRIQR
jgi:hypothetical protein